jgi:hypothetical protein
VALTEVAIKEIPTASQGREPPPKMKSLKSRFFPEK